jgi:hypothetical protein
MAPIRLLLLAVMCLAWLACGRAEERSAPEAQTPTTPPVAAPAPSDEPETFRVGEVELGRQIGADKRVSAPTTSFAPTDTIYASVETEGAAPSVSLTARWSYEDGQLVDESTETIAPTGPAVTEFHVAKPDGWPSGKYKVEIIADGRPAAEREFEVR